MLESLSVSNLAVIEKAEAVFSGGLNVLTGETGAGKSILIKALELSLGMRPSGAVVRDGAKEARIEAVFSASPAEKERISPLLDECGIGGIEDGVLVVRRSVGANGTSRAWVNDSQTAVATLRKIASLLVDVHGPRANQDILSPRFQLSAVDAFGGYSTDEYSNAWGEVETTRRAIEDAASRTASADEAEFLRYQVSELEAADLSEEDEDLAERHAAAAHLEEICRLAGEATGALGGDGGASDSLAAAAAGFSAMSRHFAAAESWRTEAEEISARVEELSRNVADAVSRLDVDPAEFERMDERLGVVNRLKRKYLGAGERTVAALLETLAEKKARLEDFDSRAEKTAALEAALAAAEAKARSAAAKLTKRRAKAARGFAAAVTDALRDLGFAKAVFSVKLGEAPLSAFGADAAEFMFEPNPGQAARPLREIASSGEIARVMLALKGVIASGQEAGTLVFDEIDANIGGETGRAVGRRMRALAEGRQIIAITHLPKSAVYADSHLVVSKRVEGGSVRTRVAPVFGEERIMEITRMLGGDSRAAKALAEELTRTAVRQ